MRRELRVKVLEFIGSNYEIGFIQGSRMEKDGKYQLLQFLTSESDAATAESILKETSNGFLEEIQGLAAGLKIDENSAIKMFSGYDLSFPSMGCTALATDNFYIRNYDFSPDIFDHRLVFTRPEQGYASVGFSQQVVGRLDGMNEHGLVVGLHLVNEGDKAKGLMSTTIVRLVLENCKNVDEAVDLIISLPHGYCYNYSLMDQQGNKCLVEASPEKQVVKKQTPLMCTNHFETEELQDKNRVYIDGSRRRKKTLQELTATTITPDDAFYQFNDEKSPLFYTDYQKFFGTLYTVVYLPETLEMTVGIGGNATPVKFSFAKWLQGNEAVGGELVGNITN